MNKLNECPLTLSRAPENAYRCSLQIRWSDQDLNRHVNNAKVLTLVEEARARAGRVWSGSNPDGGGGDPRVLRSLRTEFHSPLQYEEDISGDTMLDARVWVKSIGHTSYTVCHELLQKDQPCVYAEAVLVMLDKATLKPTPISEPIRARLTSFQAI